MMQNQRLSDASLEDGDGEGGKRRAAGWCDKRRCAAEEQREGAEGAWFLERGEGVRHRRSLSRHGSGNHGLDAPLIIVDAQGMDGAVLAAPESRPVY